MISLIVGTWLGHLKRHSAASTANDFVNHWHIVNSMKKGRKKSSENWFILLFWKRDEFFLEVFLYLGIFCITWLNLACHWELKVQHRLRLFCLCSVRGCQSTYGVLSVFSLSLWVNIGVLPVFSLSLLVKIWCSVCVQVEFTSQLVVFCLCSVWVYRSTCGVLSVFSLNLPVNMWCSVCVQFEFTSQHLVFANCIPLVLKFFNQNILSYVSAKNR